MALNLIYITNSPAVALIAEKYGVERIMIDLEALGKEERQKDMNTVISHHMIDDVATISNILTKAELLVRANHWNENSTSEIENIIAVGADRIICLSMTLFYHLLASATHNFLCGVALYFFSLNCTQTS